MNKEINFILGAIALLIEIQQIKPRTLRPRLTNTSSEAYKHLLIQQVIEPTKKDNPYVDYKEDKKTFLQFFFSGFLSEILRICICLKIPEPAQIFKQSHLQKNHKNEKKPDGEKTTYGREKPDGRNGKTSVLTSQRGVTPHGFSAEGLFL